MRNSKNKHIPKIEVKKDSEPPLIQRSVKDGSFVDRLGKGKVPPSPLSIRKK